MKNFLKKLPKIKTISVVLILSVILFLIYNYLNPAPVKIDVVKPTSKKIYQSLTYNGEIVAQNTQKLSFAVPGEIVFFDAEEGDEIEANKVIARINSYNNYVAYQKAKNNIDSIESDLKELKRKFEIDKSLFQGSDDVYEQQRKQLEQQLQNAKLELNNISSNYTDYNLISNISGTLTKKNFKLGEAVTAYSTVAEVADLKSLYFETFIDIEDIEKIYTGQKVLLALDTDAENVLQGNVIEIAKITTTDSAGDKTVEIKISLNKDNLILGTTGDAQIILKESNDNVLTIPFDTVINENGKNYVYIVENNIAKKREIKLGIEGDLDYEVIEGVNKDTVIIIDPDITIKDGTRVTNN